MKIFDHPNLDIEDWVCPICKKRDDLPVTLICLTNQDRGIAKAEQVHVECIELSLSVFDDNQGLVMFLNKNEHFDLSRLM